MNLPRLISAPLPWLTLLGSRLFGGSKGQSPIKPALSRTLRFTKEGLWYVGVLLLIGVAAINTGNNLLYLVVATLLSLIIISGIMSELTLKGLVAKRDAPLRVFKNSPAAVRIGVYNKKRFLPSYSFWIEEFPTEGVSSEPLYLLRIDRRERKEGLVRYRFHRRGRVRLEGISFATTFPFGFFIKKRRLSAPVEVLVYPAIVAMELTELPPSHQEGSTQTPSKARTGEIRSLEDYTLYDDAKLIHWKASARARRLVKKEFEAERDQRVTIVLENRGNVDEHFEATIDRAATLAHHYLIRGYEVALKTMNHTIPHSGGTEQLHRIMGFLAEVGSEQRGGRASVRVES